jgi:16S rRNA C967 or C1407 C5-methylase (RsmB/RsmF family)
VNCNYEQVNYIKFCFKPGRTAPEKHLMPKTVFGDNTMGGTKTPEFFSGFKHGEISVQDFSAQIVPPQVTQMKK